MAIILKKKRYSDAFVCLALALLKCIGTWINQIKKYWDFEIGLALATKKILMKHNVVNMSIKLKSYLYEMVTSRGWILETKRIASEFFSKKKPNCYVAQFDVFTKTCTLRQFLFEPVNLLFQGNGIRKLNN